METTNNEFGKIQLICVFASRITPKVLASTTPGEYLIKTESVKDSFDVANELRASGYNVSLLKGNPYLIVVRTQ